MSVVQDEVCVVCKTDYRKPLYRCVKCRKHFHNERCGLVPEETDSDDIGGIRRRKLRNKALCGICNGSFPADKQERAAYFDQIEQWKREFDELEKAEMELGVTISKGTGLVSRLRSDITKIEKSIGSEERRLQKLESELDGERKHWLFVDSAINQATLSHRAELTAIQEATAESGHALNYAVHMCQQKIDELSNKVHSRNSLIEKLKVSIDEKREAKNAMKEQMSVVKGLIRQSETNW